MKVPSRVEGKVSEDILLTLLFSQPPDPGALDTGPGQLVPVLLPPPLGCFDSRFTPLDSLSLFPPLGKHRGNSTCLTGPPEHHVPSTHMTVSAITPLPHRRGQLPPPSRGPIPAAFTMSLSTAADQRPILWALSMCPGPQPGPAVVGEDRVVPGGPNEWLLPASATGVSAPKAGLRSCKGSTSPGNPQEIPLHRTLSSSTQEGGL